MAPTTAPVSATTSTFTRRSASCIRRSGRRSPTQCSLRIWSEDRGSIFARRSGTSGERAIVDVVIEVDGSLVATLEHEAIIALP
jgi:hypothetical protein